MASSKPFFVYGTLMPGEFAYSQISEFVQFYDEGQIENAAIYLRDGLPALKIFNGEGYSHNRVNGYVIIPHDEHDLSNRVKLYEGTNYKLANVYVKNSQGQTIECETFLGAKIDQSHPEPWEGDWTTAFTPLIGYGLPSLFSKLNLSNASLSFDLNPGNYWTNQKYWTGDENWVGILQIEGDYLTLCSIFEYLLSLKFGRTFGNDVEKRIKELAKDPMMVGAFESLKNNPQWEVRDVTNIGAGKSAPTTLFRALDALYTTRSNLTHRGKSGMNDASTLMNATRLLAILLMKYVQLALPRVEEIWPKVIIDDVSKYFAN